MKNLLPILLATICLCGCASTENSDAQKNRKVGLQTYSLNRFTLEESLQKAKALGLDGVEIYPNQAVSKSMPNVKMNKDLSPQQRAEVKKMLSAANLKLVSMGVFGGNISNKDIKAICEFVKDMGAQRIMIESTVATFPAWKKYADENGLIVCLHHHSTKAANLYADPDVMKMLVEEYGIMACPDIGHWEASGVNPVEGLKKLEGKIGSVHIKDKRKFDNEKESKCVPFGKGEVDLNAVLAELDRQNYSGFLVIEYEAEWDNNIPSIKKSVQFLRQN